MLTRLEIKNFKRLSDVSFDLDGTVVFVGPNNAGKTSALQALSLWDFGLQSWLREYKDKIVPAKRPGITLNRKDFFAIPTPNMKNLWDKLHVRETQPKDGKPSTSNVRIVIIVHGLTNGIEWNCGFEFDYASSETCYCKPIAGKDGKLSVPHEISKSETLLTAFLPPMSGLSDREFIKQKGEIDTLIGEGQTAQVLRNLCHGLAEKQPEDWRRVCSEIKRLFDVALDSPIVARDRITLTYKEHGNKIPMDISSTGRGLQQTLLLLVYLYANPGRAILMDEPDAHLEWLRKRQVFTLLIDTAQKLNSQIIAASHSTVVLNEAAERGTVVAFVGQNPHVLPPKNEKDPKANTSQLLKALRDYGWEDYLNAERNGWVIYLEDYTDLEMLKAFARKLNHPVLPFLESPIFIHYLHSNDLPKARKHFFAIKEAKPDLLGVALLDRLDMELTRENSLCEVMWKKREFENYFCTRDVLFRFARDAGAAQWGAGQEPLLLLADQAGMVAEQKMNGIIHEFESAFATLGILSPWSNDIKATDDFLDKLFPKFYEKIERPPTLRKRDYHNLIKFMLPEEIDPEVREKLDAIYEVANKATTQPF